MLSWPAMVSVGVTLPTTTVSKPFEYVSAPQPTGLSCLHAPGIIHHICRYDYTSRWIPVSECQPRRGSWSTSSSSLAGSSIKSSSILTLAATISPMAQLVKYGSSARATRDRWLRLTGKMRLQAFCTTLSTHIMEYYRLIALLESQVRGTLDRCWSRLSVTGAKQVDGDSTNEESAPLTLTLRRLVVWTHDPLLKLQTLVSLVDVCSGKLGTGAVAPCGLT